MKAEYPDHLDYWGDRYAFDRDRTGDLGIMRPTRCQLRHESCDVVIVEKKEISATMGMRNSFIPSFGLRFKLQIGDVT